MAPVNKGKVLFNCREATCVKNFTDRSSRDRHEKRFNHKPLKRKSEKPLFDDRQRNTSVLHLDTLQHSNSKGILFDI